MDVPVKYTYLKNNASMHDPTTSHKKTALSTKGTVKKSATTKDVRGGVPGKRKVVIEEDEDEGEDEGDDDEEEHHEGSERNDGEDSAPRGR